MIHVEMDSNLHFPHELLSFTRCAVTSPTPGANVRFTLPWQQLSVTAGEVLKKTSN